MTSHRQADDLPKTPSAGAAFPPPVAITLNGERVEVEAGCTVLDLLARLRVQPRRVVVEHNRRLLRGDDLAAVRIHEGDEVEVLHLVGGG